MCLQISEVSYENWEQEQTIEDNSFIWKFSEKVTYFWACVGVLFRYIKLYINKYIFMCYLELSNNSVVVCKCH